MRIVSWNMNHWARPARLRARAWAYLREGLKADVALTQESVPPSDANQRVYRPLHDTHPRYQWGTAVVALNSEITVRERKGGWTIGVKETNRTVITEVRRLSQGVQRMFTLVTFLTLLELEDHAITVLIDDFGEGLDFEHAGRAATFLISKAGSTKLQFIVATNDRYVMNAVPLDIGRCWWRKETEPTCSITRTRRRSLMNSNSPG